MFRRTKPEKRVRRVRKRRNPQEKRAFDLVKSYTDMRAQVYNFPTEPEIIQYPQSGSQLRSIVWRVPVLRTCIDNLMMQHYRRLPMLKPKFLSKCPLCGMEYEETKKVCDNPSCVMQGAQCIGPDSAQKQIFEKFKKKVNRNGDSYWDMCKQFTYEMHISDNPWRIYTFDYQFQPLSGEVYKQLLEITCPPPDSVRLIMDQFGVPGGLYWTCIEHRDVLVGADEEKVCPECGKALYNVTACSLKDNAAGNVMTTQNIDKPYIDGEWYHRPYYTPTITYGISQVYTCWTLGSSLYYMDNLELNTFKMGRPPKTFLIFNTHNAPSLKEQIKSEMTASKENRNYVPTVAFPFEGKNPATVLNLLPTDAEIQNLEHRKDIRDRIGAAFGVQPIFQADSSTGGGLNNEGQQLTVTLIRQETLHRWEESGAFAQDFEALGITDWELEYPPLKEEDRMAIQMRRKENLQMLGLVLDRGADYVITNPEDWEFKIVGKLAPLPKAESGMPGQGFKEMGGGLAGWNMRDWMQEDSSFAFSLKKDDFVKKLVLELVEQLKLASGFSESVRLEAMMDLFWKMWDQFRGYLRYNLGRYIRVGLNMTGHDYDSAHIDESLLQDVMDAYDVLFDGDVEIIDTIQSYATGGGEGELSNLYDTLTPYLENILDTESSAFVNQGMAEGYRLSDPDDMMYDYYWSGPDYTDGRSTLCCQAIKDRFEQVRRVDGRVSLEQAERIVSDESDKPHGREKAFRMGRRFMPHYRCRHRLLATPVLSKSIVYIHDRSEAPAGAPIFEGPSGGLYYETTARNPAGVEEDGDGGSAGAVRSDDQGGLGGMAEGARGGSGQYLAVGLRGSGGKWEIKYYKPEDQQKIEQLLQAQGFRLGEGYTIEVREAIKDEGGAGSGNGQASGE